MSKPPDSSAAPSTSPVIRAAGVVLMIGLLLIAIELAGLVLVTLTPSLLNKFIYYPPQVTDTAFDSYLEQRNPRLGWPSHKWLAENADRFGARRSPANDALGDTSPCIALYGDSFTFSEEVGDADAWGDRLAARLGCRVHNFGMGGYGTGQAVLRLVENQSDPSPVVVIGIYPANFNRIVNRWRYLIDGQDPLSFKPMVHIDEGGEISILPLPVDTLAQFQALALDPAQYLEDEMFLPDTAPFRSKIRAGFPYSLTLLRVFSRVVAQMDLDRIAWDTRIREWNYSFWYDSPAGLAPRKTETMREILNLAGQVCRERSARCVVLLIPDPEMMNQVQAGNPHGLELLSGLVPEDVAYADATAYLAEAARIQGTCHYYGRERNCIGHFNPDGYALLAEYVATLLDQDIP